MEFRIAYEYRALHCFCLVSCGPGKWRRSPVPGAVLANLIARHRFCKKRYIFYKLISASTLFLFSWPSGARRPAGLMRACESPTAAAAGRLGVVWPTRIGRFLSEEICQRDESFLLFCDRCHHDISFLVTEITCFSSIPYRDHLDDMVVHASPTRSPSA